jgi:hypothetical protein
MLAQEDAMSEAIPQFQVRILGARPETDKLHQSLHAISNLVEIQKYEKAEQGTNLGFGIAEVMLIVSVIKGATAFALFCKAVHDLMKSSQTKTIVIQTPTGRVEIRSHETLTLKEVEDAISRAVRRPT